MEGEIHIDGDYHDLKPGEGVEGYDFGADLDVKGVPLIDPGEGKTISIRVFDFKMNPQNIRHFPSNKQTVFSAHAKQISTILWGDGLQPLESVAPRVIIDKRKASYRIFVACEAQRGVLFSSQNQPKNLSEELAKEQLKSNKK